MASGKHNNHSRGSAHHRWSGRIESSHGYAKVRVGTGHPLADPNGYAYEHLVVWVSAGRPTPSADEVLHHKNEDRLDNRIENLELVTRSEHNKHHNKDRHRRSDGTFA